MKKTLMLLMAFGAFITLAGCFNTKEVSNTDSSILPTKETIQPIEPQDIKTQITFEETSYDFGKIKQSAGKVSHDFKFTYQGTEAIKVTGVPTSCACTSATIDKSELQPGESGVVTVKFNPNLHAEPEGKFFKTVILLTDPKLTIQPEIKIRVEIDLDLGPDAFELQDNHDDEGEEESEGTDSYHAITSAQFDNMLTSKDFVLMDTHIPEQEHIAGTDMMIPYNDIESYEEQLPADKNTKIVVYCRSGPMSRAAAYQLVEHGYTNVYDLMGGKKAYDIYRKTKKEVKTETNESMRVIDISAKQREFTPSTIRVKQGEKVMLKITDTDTKHGIRIGNMEKARYSENEVILDTSNKGEFFFGCANYCGSGHMNMGGKIIVE